MERYPMTEYEIKMLSPSNEGGETKIYEHDISLILENIHFIVKMPLQPVRQIAMDLPGPVMTTTVIPEEKLTEAGLVKAETPDSGEVFFNPNKIQFYFSPELSVYVLMFPNNSRVGIKITKTELMTALGKSSLIL
jgi:hypothetical protein